MVVRIGDVQPGKRVQTKVNPDVEALGPVRGDHLVDYGGESLARLPVGEQVHILARALENAVRRDRVPTGRGEPERPADPQSDLGKPAVDRRGCCRPLPRNTRIHEVLR
jgi:hypothetical protein